MTMNQKAQSVKHHKQAKQFYLMVHLQLSNQTVFGTVCLTT